MDGGTPSITTPAGLPQTPVKPADAECCGGGCSVCVFDLYEIQLSSWKNKCHKLEQNGFSQSTSYEGENSFLLSLIEFRQFKIKSIQSITHDTKLFEIDLPMNNVLNYSTPPCIWHVVLRLFCSQSETFTNRSFTPMSSSIIQINSKSDSFQLQLVIKIYPDGRFSKLISSLVVGSCIEIMGPIQSDFQYQKYKYDGLLLLAAGTGLLPMIQLASLILTPSDTSQEPDDTRIRLLLANKTRSDILFRRELLDLTRYWNFSVRHFLSRGDPLSTSATRSPMSGVHEVTWGEEIFEGRISMTAIAEEITKYGLEGREAVIICGTQDFEESMLTFCTQLGLAKFSLKL